MTADEAKQALKEGKKICPTHWKGGGYFRLISSGVVVNEIAVIYDCDTLFEILKYVDWEIVE